MSSETGHDLQLVMYPFDDGYICSINIDNDAEYESLHPTKIQTVIILDRSGSMGGCVGKVLNEVLPIFFNKLKYIPEDIIHLITFDSCCELFTLTVSDFGYLPQRCQGCTNMTLALNKFKELFTSLDMNMPVRVLTISDGLVDNQMTTKQAGDQLADFVTKCQVPINSQAMRFFTSRNQPDTTALCSILQINNTISPRLLDQSAHSSPEDIATQLVQLFDCDGFTNGLWITAETPAFLNLPWETERLKSIIVRRGQNVFWMKDQPLPNEVRVHGNPVNVKIETNLSHEKFNILIHHKMPLIINNMKVLRVLGTEKATELSKIIVEYFNVAEDRFVNDNHVLTDNAMNLNARVRKMINKRRKYYSNLLATIANDCSISQLNSAQKADYLRQVDSSQNSRGLARRAVKGGLNFDEIARNEVLAMAQHFHEIEDIDDSKHYISFFSQDSTFGGIKELVKLSEDESFQTFDVNEILEILNLVGVGCSGPIGDYPDPSTWQVKEIFLGCNVSLSDVLVAFNQSNGQTLRAPAIDKEIINVIPIFDEKRVGDFLKKYAPSLLEYTFSIGMRRIIADVPMTIGYTMCAGTWKMIAELSKSTSTLHWEIFKKFVSTFDGFVGKYFDHIKPLLREQTSKKKMFYLANNGIAKMMSPLIRIYVTNDVAILKLVPAILRSLYSLEVWHGIRRLYKKSEFPEQIAESILYKLLGIDMSNKVTVKPPFVEEPIDITFYDQPNIDYGYLNELIKPLFYVDYLTLIPTYLKAFADNSDSIKDIPTVSKTTALEVEYDYNEFMLFNVFQAARYRTLASREDADSETMKIVDLKDRNEAMEDIKSYVRQQFENDYVQQLSQKAKIENESMGDHIASQILSAESYDAMISLWRNGVVRNSVTHKISTASKSGFKRLVRDLFQRDIHIPQRINIIKVLLLGIDDKGEAVWNHGGICFSVNIKEMESKFLEYGTLAEWTSIMSEFKERRKHNYREYKGNRQGHGNDKPSFWAMGYGSLIEFRNTVPLIEFQEYCKNHRRCCGVRNLENEFLLTL